MSSDTLYLIVIVVCVIMSAFFSASETAFSTSNKIRLKAMGEAGSKSANSTLKLLDNFDSLISSILIGNNIVNILSTSLATILFVTWFGEAKGPTLCTIVTTIVVLVFGEVTPKSVAKEFPESFAIFATPFLRLVVLICSPFNYLFSVWKGLINKLFKKKDDVTTTEKELLMFVEETAQVGTITEEESEMIHTVLQFSDLCAVDVMTPMFEVTSISVDDTVDTVHKVFKETGYSRLPVKNKDGVSSIIYYKDFYDDVLLGNKAISSIYKPAHYVLSTKNVKELMNELKDSKNHMAIIIDEYGLSIGIITLEDILEELVGDIWDEGDDIEHDIEQLSDTEYRVSGMVSLKKLSSELNIDFKPTDASTVNGFVMGLLSKLPVKNEIVNYENLQFEIISMNKTRIDSLKIKRM